jgi:hypothetical protein
MIEPLPKGEPYPGLLPSPLVQWQRLNGFLRIALVVLPLLVVVILLAADFKVGVVGAVMVFGVGAASAVYVKNRTDRHNAAVERGEIRVVADPHLRRTTAAALDEVVLARLAGAGFPPHDIGEVTRFDGGWLVKRRNARDVAVVAGDDGGHALFDPRSVDALRAATEYRAGRGRQPAD